jgi:cytochrome c oxidase subunit 4
MTTSQPKLQTYYVVYLLLLAGLAATVGIAHIPLGTWNLLAALAIAFAKATLVVLFFMHVLYSPRLIGLAVFAGLVWLGILLALVLADYDTRSWMPVKPVPGQRALPDGEEAVEPPRSAAAPGGPVAPADAK